LTKNNRGFEHENTFQEVNQQNSSTRFFFFFELDRSERSVNPTRVAEALFGMSVLLRIGGFTSGLASGVTMYYLCVVQRMQQLQQKTIDRVSGMEKQLAATNACNT
jgi:hypothetical protein